MEEPKESRKEMIARRLRNISDVKNDGDIFEEAEEKVHTDEKSALKRLMSDVQYGGD